MAKKRNFAQHWPVMSLALIVVAIFGIALFSFQVKETEYAVVKTFGSPKEVDGKIKVYKPGLHFRWPEPIQEIWRHDNRLQCYELKTGRVEQVPMHDDYQVVVTTFALWKVGDVGQFQVRTASTEIAENHIDTLVRNSRNLVLGKHMLSELINVDPTKIKMKEIEEEMLDDAREMAKEWGIDIVHIGFKHIGFPDKVTAKVFDRMVAERSRKIKEHLAQGASEATEIRATADREASAIRNEAMGKAKQIRGEGDQIAATHYAAFSKNPELAIFLRKLDSLRLTLSKKTTLVLDTNTAPYDLLLPGSFELSSEKAKEKSTKVKGE